MTCFFSNGPSITVLSKVECANLISYVAVHQSKNVQQVTYRTLQYVTVMWQCCVQQLFSQSPLEITKKWILQVPVYEATSLLYFGLYSLMAWELVRRDHLLPGIASISLSLSLFLSGEEALFVLDCVKCLLSLLRSRFIFDRLRLQVFFQRLRLQLL